MMNVSKCVANPNDVNETMKAKEIVKNKKKQMKKHKNDNIVIKLSSDREIESISIYFKEDNK